jgi:hypothetical protein
VGEKRKRREGEKEKGEGGLGEKLDYWKRRKEKGERGLGEKIRSTGKRKKFQVKNEKQVTQIKLSVYPALWLGIFSMNQGKGERKKEKQVKEFHC